MQNDLDHIFVCHDIGDGNFVSMLLKKYQAHATIKFAIENDIDRLIHGSEDFIKTDVVGFIYSQSLSVKKEQTKKSSDEEILEFFNFTL